MTRSAEGLAGLLLILLSACASTPVNERAPASASPPAPVTSTGTEPASAIEPFHASAPPRIETETFALELHAPASASAGAAVPIALTVEGRGGYHVNLEYPMRIELGGSHDAAFEVAILAAKDASELSEARARFGTQARFESAGKHFIAARAQLAVCTEETCIPFEEALALEIDVR